MTPTDFIIANLKIALNKFPSIKVRYEDFSISNTHFVEVVQNDFYKINKDYLTWEEEISFQFIDKFPDQNLCFISDDAVVGIENVSFELAGENYFTPNFNFQFPLTTNSIDKILQEYLEISVVKRPTILNNIIGNISLNNSSKSTPKELELHDNLYRIKSNNLPEFLGETSFAMAA